MHADKNYYDKNGILLLAKDQELTDQVLSRLRNHSVISQELLRAGNRLTGERINTAQISKKLKVQDKRIFDIPAQILSEIIFDSRTTPWWFTINALSNYIPWIYTHSINVALLSMIIGKSMGYGDELLWELGLGGLLHDIGKMMVPKAIIQKQGKLTPDEMTFMQQHCELGVSIVADCEIPENSKMIILQHHERNDGSGYPYGLTENSIHQSAQIATVADVVDAITSSRPYRAAKDFEVAYKILAEKSEIYPIRIVEQLRSIL